MTTTPIPVDDLDDLTRVEISVPLSLGDRCDRCQAQAFVRAAILVRQTGKMVDLLFCGHHFHHHYDMITATAMHVQDDTDRINKKASESSV